MDPSIWHNAWAGIATPAVADAVARLGLQPGARVLDVGTGGGVALPALAEAGGAHGHVTAVDVEEAAISVARRRVADTAVSDRVDFRHARIEEVIDSSAPAAFDAIWTGDVLWRNYFRSPLEIVKGLATLLTSGGVLAIFTGNWDSSRFMHGHPDLERRVLAASALRWQVPGDGACEHHEMMAVWMTAAGFRDVKVSMHPIVGTSEAANWSAWTHYLEVAVWPDYRAAVHDHSSEVGIDAATAAGLAELLSPASPTYLPRRPGYFAFQPTLLVSGRR